MFFELHLVPLWHIVRPEFRLLIFHKALKSDKIQMGSKLLFGILMILRFLLRLHISLVVLSMGYIR